MLLVLEHLRGKTRPLTICSPFHLRISPNAPQVQGGDCIFNGLINRSQEECTCSSGGVWNVQKGVKVKGAKRGASVVLNRIRKTQKTSMYQLQLPRTA
jgi:hypothetical protein